MTPSWIGDGIGLGGFSSRSGKEAAHVSDLLALLDDDRLRETLEPFIAPMLQQHQGHVDGALMVRNHHLCKITIDIVARRDFHGFMHPRIRLRDLGMECRLRSIQETVAPWNGGR